MQYTDGVWNHYSNLTDRPTDQPTNRPSNAECLLWYNADSNISIHLLPFHLGDTICRGFDNLETCSIASASRSSLKCLVTPANVLANSSNHASLMSHRDKIYLSHKTSTSSSLKIRSPPECWYTSPSLNSRDWRISLSIISLLSSFWPIVLNPPFLMTSFSSLRFASALSSRSSSTVPLVARR